MTVFIDTNVLVYAVSPGPRRQVCQAILRGVATGDFSATTNSLVIEELWHLERRRDLGLPAGIARDMLEVFPYIVAVGDWAVQSAFAIETAPHLGTADRVHAATCRTEHLTAIVTADTSFDNLDWLERIDPTETALPRLHKL